MGRIARLLSFTRALRNGARVNDVKVDPGGGPNVTAEHFADAGDDSHPLTTDYVSMNTDSGTGRETAAGYLDPINSPLTRPGEKRIYGRDPSTGASVVEVWLQADGTARTSNADGSVTLLPDGGAVAVTPNATFAVSANGSITGSNGAGAFELEPGGDFVANGVTIDPNGNMSVPSSLVLNGKEIAEHTHSQADDSGGNREEDTGPNN